MTGDFKRGFITSGLFRYSRHPNFFAEQCVWWALALFSVAVTGDWTHWTFVGAVLLSLLFQVCILSAQLHPACHAMCFTHCVLFPRRGRRPSPNT
jgi:steroid 5-alpha reductase family enzyme